MEKENMEYKINVKLNFTNYITAGSKKQALDILKESFVEMYNIELKEEEIEIEEFLEEENDCFLFIT